MQPQPLPPDPGQELVWDYPRPPRLEDTSRHIQVVFNGALIADTRRRGGCWKPAIHRSTTSRPKTFKCSI